MAAPSTGCVFQAAITLFSMVQKILYRLPRTSTNAGVPALCDSVRDLIKGQQESEKASAYGGN